MDINDEYYKWLRSIVDKHIRDISYGYLLDALYHREYDPALPMDSNRAGDGLGLRYRFSDLKRYRYEDVEAALPETCSMLEMMIALALRCEETIMDNPQKGNRTKQWFWQMVASLGLSSMTDDNYDRRYVRLVLNQFMRNDYEPDGHGGLFTIYGSKDDLRNVEIWVQLLWYLDTIS